MDFNCLITVICQRLICHQESQNTVYLYVSHFLFASPDKITNIINSSSVVCWLKSQNKTIVEGKEQSASE